MNSPRKVSACVLRSLLLTVAACSSRPAGDKGAGGSAAPVSSGGAGGGSSAAAIPESEKPLDVMTRAMRAQLNAKSYRAHVMNMFDDNPINEMLIEYVAPDSFRLIQTGRSSDNKMESVVVRGATYIKMPDGEWAKSLIDASVIIKSVRDPKMLDELAKTADVKLVGPDTFDGAPMLVYQYTQNNPLDMNLKNTSKTWLSVADGLPRKTESEGEYEGHKTKTLVTMFDYNADIKIESPVK